MTGENFSIVPAVPIEIVFQQDPDRTQNPDGITAALNAGLIVGNVEWYKDEKDNKIGGKMLFFDTDAVLEIANRGSAEKVLFDCGYLIVEPQVKSEEE